MARVFPRTGFLLRCTTSPRWVSMCGLRRWRGARRGWPCCSTGAEAPEYRAALAFQMRLGDAIANALGYQGEHFRLVDARRHRRASKRAVASGPRRWAARVRRDVRRRPPEKRTTLRPGARPPCRCMRRCRSEMIPLPAGRALRRASPINRDTCTMCLACVGVVPRRRDPRQPGGAAAALHRDASACNAASARQTCPEHAITLVPRLDLDAGRHGAARAQRGGDRQLHHAAASRSAREKMIDDDAGEARRAFDVRRAGRARPPAGCAPTAASIDLDRRTSDGVDIRDL